MKIGALHQSFYIIAAKNHEIKELFLPISLIFHFEDLFFKISIQS
jgi:hypothetical protein